MRFGSSCPPTSLPTRAGAGGLGSDPSPATPTAVRLARVPPSLRPLLLFPLFLFPLFLLPLQAGAQEAAGETRSGSPAMGAFVDPESLPRPEARAVRTPTPPTIDGSLQDEVWALAEVIDTFIQSQPVAGAPATDPTHVRILYDDTHLYIGILALESDPGSLVVRSLRRDFAGGSTRDMDVVAVALDTFLDRRNSFLLMVNPYGALRDGQTFDDSRSLDFGWDGAIEVATHIHAEGWNVEMAIPWTTLRFHAAPGEQAWGMNILRRVRRKNEDSYWAPVDRRNPVHRMSRGGTLRGLQDLPANRNLSAKPYLLGEHRGGADTPTSLRGGQADAGFDVKWGITPSLTLDGTFNTDFSQVEVDQQQVNLTRFPLFFPERRDFFVENSGSFVFGDVSERNYRQGASLRDFTLFHSRRIGLRDGEAVPMLGGARISGQLGGGELGALSMRTDALPELPGEAFHVLRYRREVAPGASLGGMVLHRSGAGELEPGSSSWGVDGDLRTGGGFILNGYLAGTRVEGVGGDPLAMRLGVGWRTQEWNVSALHRRIGDGFRPTMGFVRRTGIRQSYGTVGTHRRPDLPGVQEVSPWVALDHLAGVDGGMVGRTLELGNELEFQDGSTVSGRVVRQMELLRNPFVVQGVTIPAGRYDETEWTLSYGSSAARALSGEVRLGGGGYFDGRRRSVGLEGVWQVNPHLGLDASVDWNDLDLPAGGFRSNVYRGRVMLDVNTRTFASGYLQYNDALDQLVTNLRFNLIHAPLSDVFLVLTERRQTGGGGLPPGALPGVDGGSGAILERMLALKVTRHLTF